MPFIPPMLCLRLDDPARLPDPRHHRGAEARWSAGANPYPRGPHSALPIESTTRPRQHVAASATFGGRGASELPELAGAGRKLNPTY
jgi:hypothetical protein